MNLRTLIAVVLVWKIATLAGSIAQTAPAPPVPPTPSGGGLAPTASADASFGYDPAQYQKELEKRKARMEKGGWNVRVDVQMVAMPQPRALQLLPELQSDDAAKVEAAVKRIQDMIAKNEATLMGWPHVVTFDGEKAVAESILEKRSPSDFELPQQPQNFSGAATPKKPKEPTLIPTSFETRNTGATLEVEPTVLENGDRIGLSLVTQRVTLLRNDTFVTGVTKDGAAAQLDQPQFTTEKTTTTLVVRNREHVLLAVHSLHTPGNEIEFFILRAVATKLD